MLVKKQMNNHLLNLHYLKYTIKANPSPNGNGFAFNLFGDTQVNKMNKVYIVKNTLVFVMQLD